MHPLVLNSVSSFGASLDKHFFWLGGKLKQIFISRRGSCSGLSGGGEPSSLLSSIPCELAFSSMRDSAKRHAKQERQSPPALHCVAWKSAGQHPCGSMALDLEPQDWADPLSQKYVKQHVHSALRCTDKELGVSCEGLTRHRVNKAYTKPHIYCQRLSLLRTLASVYSKFVGEGEDRRAEILQLHSNLSVSQLFGAGKMVYKST